MPVLYRDQTQGSIGIVMGNDVFAKIREKGWEVKDINNGLLVANLQFGAEIDTLDEILAEFRIDIENHIIKRGGGQADQTLDLTSKLVEQGWLKENVTIQNEISFSSGRDSRISGYTTHEVDHFIHGNNGHIAALEIEWNNKDEFYDRDFQAMRRLYESHVIELGIIVTRGNELEDCMAGKIEEYFCSQSINSLNDFGRLVAHFTVDGSERFSFPTNPQKISIQNKSRTRSFAKASAEVFTKSKYVSTSTNWKQLEKRISRKDAGRTPMIFLGIPPIFSEI